MDEHPDELATSKSSLLSKVTGFLSRAGLLTSHFRKGLWKNFDAMGQDPPAELHEDFTAFVDVWAPRVARQSVLVTMVSYTVFWLSVIAYMLGLAALKAPPIVWIVVGVGWYVLLLLAVLVFRSALANRRAPQEVVFGIVAAAAAFESTDDHDWSDYRQRRVLARQLEAVARNLQQSGNTFSTKNPTVDRAIQERFTRRAAAVRVRVIDVAVSSVHTRTEVAEMLRQMLPHALAGEWNSLAESEPYEFVQHRWRMVVRGVAFLLLFPSIVGALLLIDRYSTGIDFPETAVIAFFIAAALWIGLSLAVMLNKGLAESVFAGVKSFNPLLPK
jgi:hypothetical protein